MDRNPFTNCYFYTGAHFNTNSNKHFHSNSICYTISRAVGIHKYWDRYQPRTLASIIQNTTDEVNPGSDLLIWVNYGDDTPSIVKVEYTGEFRELSDIRKALVRLWKYRYGISEAQAFELFQEEGRFVENGVDFWMPVQSQLIPYMEDELQIGQEVELLVVWPGVVNEDGESVWVFFVNSF